MKICSQCGIDLKNNAWDCPDVSQCIHDPLEDYCQDQMIKYCEEMVEKYGRDTKEYLQACEMY